MLIKIEPIERLFDKSLLSIVLISGDYHFLLLILIYLMKKDIDSATNQSFKLLGAIKKQQCFSKQGVICKLQPDDN